jgi:hypothetical protein
MEVNIRAPPPFPIERGVEWSNIHTLTSFGELQTHLIAKSRSSEWEIEVPVDFLRVAVVFTPIACFTRQILSSLRIYHSKMKLISRHIDRDSSG